MDTKNKLLILFAVALAGAFLLFVFVFLLISEGNKENSSATPSFDLPKNSGASSGQFAPLSSNEEELNRRSFAVSALIKKLPYSGKAFTLSYSFSGGSFILYVNPSKKDEGNSEFEQFLKSNEIDDRSWVDNLFISYISPTPTQPKSK